MDDGRGWGSKIRDSIKGKIKDSLDHRAAVKEAYSTAKREEELKYAAVRARQDVRGTGSRSNMSERFMNAARMGSGGGRDDFGSRMDSVLGGGSPKKSSKSMSKKRKKKSKSRPRKPRSESYAERVDRALGGF